MTVAQLIAELQRMPQHREVRVLLSEVVTGFEFAPEKIVLNVDDALEAEGVRDEGQFVLIGSK